MKKVFFAAFAGACVMTSILATPAKTNSAAFGKISQVTDTVPSKDTSKLENVVMLRDTVPSDTTKKFAFNNLRDTVPSPTDTTTKKINFAVLRDTVPSSDTSSKKINFAMLRDTVPTKDTAKIQRVHMNDLAKL